MAGQVNKVVKRGGATGGPGSHTVLRLPLPLALSLCFVFFYAGSLFGGTHLSSLPDMKQPRKVSAGRGDSSGAARGADRKAASSSLRPENVSSPQTLVGAGASQSRRQLAAHGEDTQAILHSPGEVGEVGEGKSRVVQLPRLGPFPHGPTGFDEVETVAVQMLSWKPRAYIFPGFASGERCDEIVALAKRHMHPSGLALRPGETVEATRDIRTSSGAFISSAQDPSGSLKWVEEKMARVSMIPPQHGEAYNVLRYELGQHYDSHMDVFDPKEYGPQKSNRVASFLLYLTDVEEGGETMFPYEGGKNMHIGYNFKDCIGLKVKPKKGDALLFWSMFPDGSIDPHSLHGSCPVRKGEKWVATKWIRDKAVHW